MATEYRIGQGFDVHRFAKGRKLILGGVEIRHDKGLIGHSDADVVTHALMNALLGAMGEGDIGIHFPDADSRYKDIASTKLLQQVVAQMRRKKFALVNADITIIAQQPKVAPYYGRIQSSLARSMKVALRKLNIKAVTTEKLGWVGEGEGIAASAVVLLGK
jgi:2-C-methyl-D-erythritol 2,4-cyclodiphosphate synthase